LIRYQAAIDAGRDLEEITGWINKAKAARLTEAALQPGRRRPERRPG
jgi:hypothetical protein